MGCGGWGGWLRRGAWGLAWGRLAVASRVWTGCSGAHATRDSRDGGGDRGPPASLTDCVRPRFARCAGGGALRVAVQWDAPDHSPPHPSPSVPCTVTVVLGGVGAGCLPRVATARTIDDTHASPRAKWIELGMPACVDVHAGLPSCARDSLPWRRPWKRAAQAVCLVCTAAREPSPGRGGRNACAPAAASRRATPLTIQTTDPHRQPALARQLPRLPGAVACGGDAGAVARYPTPAQHAEILAASELTPQPIPVLAVEASPGQGVLKVLLQRHSVVAVDVDISVC